LAWAILGYAEELEFFASIDREKFEQSVGLSKADVIALYEEAAKATADHYIDACSADGIPYWDDGAPGLSELGNWRERSADPFNDFEPVDSSAAVIAAQGLIRLGNYLGAKGERYRWAGLSIARTLFAAPYLAEADQQEGLLLHSVYHRPNGWDHVPAGKKVPCGESSMWGDYHALELALLLQRMKKNGRYLTFYDASVAMPTVAP